MPRQSLYVSFHAIPAANRRVSLRCTVTVDGKKATPFSTYVYCAAKQWETKTNTIRNSQEDTERLRIIKQHLEQIFNEALRKETPISAREVVSLYLSKGKKAFPTYAEVAEKHLSLIELREGHDLGHRSIETYHVYYTTFLKYLAATKRKNIGVNEIDIPLVKGYEVHLIGRRLSETTIKKSVRYVKSVLTYAVNHGILEANRLAVYAFERYSKNVKDIVFLSFEESAKIFTKQYGNPTMQKIVDLLHFACLTSLAFGDLENFDYQKHTYVDEGEVWVKKLRKKKTGVQIFPLEPAALGILQKYDYSLPRISNQQFNKWLKELALQHGIEKNLDTHTGRRTFVSQNFMNGKYGLEAMSRITGDNPATLLKYYGKLMPQAIKNDRDNFNKKRELPRNSL
jgi:site-specific recombinase XerD